MEDSNETAAKSRRRGRPKGSKNRNIENGGGEGRRSLPPFITNIIILVIILGIVVAAQFLLKREREEKVQVKISPVEITAGEEVEGAPPETVETVETAETAEAVETVETPEAPEVPEKAEVPEKVVEEKHYSDPYTSGGPLDLDSPATREQYLSNSDAPSPAKKPLPPDNYTDNSNPWNSGGVHDLDYRPGSESQQEANRR